MTNTFCISHVHWPRAISKGLLCAYFIGWFLSPSTASERQEKLDSIAGQISQADSLYHVDMQSAYSVLRQTMSALESLQADSLYCHTLIKLGTSCLNLNKPDSAIYYIEHGLQRCSYDGRPGPYIEARVALAGAYEMLNNPRMALEICQETLEQVSENDEPISVLTLYMGLASAHQMLGEFEQQKKYSLRAKAMMDEHKLERYFNHVHSYLAVAYSNVKMLDSAVYFHQRVMDHARERNDTRYQAITMMNIGELFLSNQQLDSAEHYLLQAKQQVKEVNEPRMEDFLGNLLSNLWAAKGDYKAAYDQVRTDFERQSSVTEQRHITALNDMRVKYDTQLKEQEIERLEQESLIRELELGAARTRLLFIGLGLLFVVIALAVVIFFYRQLMQAKKALAAANATKDKFFTIIAHDLKGGTNAFEGIGRMMKHYLEKGKQEKAAELTEVMDRSALRLSELLDNLLNWALTQQDMVDHQPAQLNLSEVVHAVVEQLKSYADAKRLNLTVEIPASLIVHADRQGLSLIVRNLAMNAVKFTPEEGTVRLKADQQGNKVVLKVQDSGTGMDQQTQEQLFSIESRNKRAGTAGEQGSGIGLKLVKEFLELNKASIEVDSKLGKGTTISVTLPSHTMPK